jgi:WhiB family redox-sensing transcriptional regulator
MESAGPGRRQAKPPTGTPPATAPGPQSWRGDGACRGADPELFFAPPSQPDLTAQAKAICARCAVIGPCRAWALESGPADGVVGGLDSKERRTLRRRALKAKAKARADSAAA